MKKVKFIYALFVILSAGIFFSGCTKQQETISLTESGSDDQPYWNIFNHRVTKAENGYYYIKELDGTNKDAIFYMDGESCESIILCGKAECSHNDKDCNAVLISSGGTSGINGDRSEGLYYYKGALYILHNEDAEGLTYLEQIAADGSYRKKLFEIGPESPAYCLVFHDDSVYIYQRQGGVSGYEETTATIRRRSLDGREDEIIYEHTAQGAVVYAVKSYGGRLFFVMEEEGRAGTEKHSERIYERKGVFAYDYQTKQVQQVCDEAVCDYTVDEKNNTIYYYVFNDGLYKRNLSEKTAKKIYNMTDKETNICQVSFDGTYLYLSNEQYSVFFYEKTDYYLYVLDTDGKELNKIPTERMYSTYFGDDKYVFNLGITKKFSYIRKSDILTAKEWKNVELK